MTNLESEEKELLESIERGEWRSIDNLEAEKKRYQKYAKETFKKDQRINIRLSQQDLKAIQTLAREEGIPYQTLITSVLHKYVSGRLVDKKWIAID
jgi:predicted DNA binding CopG/RHH family protein